MSRRAVSLLALALSHAAFVAAMALTYGRLPLRVASHFDATGTPNDWMSRPWYIGLMFAFAVGLSTVVVGIFYATRFFPASCINLPHKEHWLAPERRVTTMDFLLRMGAWLATWETLWLLTLHLLVVAANQAQPVRLSTGVWGLFLGFLVVLGGWILTFVLRIYRVKSV